MVYEWGSPVTPITEIEVTGDYEAKVGEIMKYFTKRTYQRDTKISPFDFEKTLAPAVADKIREEGHEPYYVKCEVVNYYWVGDIIGKWVYEIEVTWMMKITHASPISWAKIAGIIIAIAITALVLTLLYVPVEKFWKIVVDIGEALGTALGLPAGAGTGLLVIGMIVFFILILILIMRRR